MYRQTSPIVLTTEPSLEPTEPESTGPPEKKPSIEIANAPVGGGQFQGPRDCVQLSWLAEEPPDGTTIKLERIYFTWSGTDRPITIFEVDPSSCRGVAGAPLCAAGQEWTRGGQNSCSVGVNQVVPASRPVTVKLRVTVTCERQADCDNVLKQAKDSPRKPSLYHAGSPYRQLVRMPFGANVRANLRDTVGALVRANVQGAVGAAVRASSGVTV